MINRTLLIILGIFSLTWIGFVSYGLLHTENSSDFRRYFNASDAVVWAVHHPQEVHWDDHGIQTLSLNQSIYSSLVPKLKEPSSFLFSKKRVLFLIEKKTSWEKQDVKSLFQNGLFPFEMGKLNDFAYGKLHGVFKGNQLLIYEGELNAPNGHYFHLDTKASFSKIILNKSKQKFIISDTYVKQGKIYTYTKSEIGKNKVNELDDRRIFAPFVPSTIDSYEFYEKSYLAMNDRVFAQSHFSSQMITSGVVFISKDSMKAAIFDYQEEYSPVEILNEKLHLEESNENNACFKNLRFSLFLENKNSPHKDLYVAQSNGFAVVSYSKELVDFVIAEAELAHTLSQDEKRTSFIYGDLPQKVACRLISKQKHSSYSVYGTKLVETKCRYMEVVEHKDNQKMKDYFVMNPGERVLDFVAFPERGNVIAFTDKGKLVGYQNGLKKWEKACPEEVSDMYLLNIGQSYAAIQIKNEVQLFDRTGRLVFRMPNQPTVQMSAYSLKNKLEFVISNTSNSIQVLNDKGNVVKPFQVNGEIRQIEISYRAKKPVLAILTTSTCYSVDLEKRKMIGKINADSTFRIVNAGNELTIVSLEKGTFHVLKNGRATQFQTKNNVHLLASYVHNNELIYVLSRGKELFAYQSNGNMLWEKSIQSQEISSMSISYSKNGTPLLCVLDAIENELYIFDPLGRASDQNERHGEGQVQISPFGTSAYSITTFLGSYLIQYTKQ